MLNKHLKKLTGLALSSVMIMGIFGVAYANEGTSTDLRSGYSQIATRSQGYGIPFSMTFKEYVDAYDESGFTTPQEYADAYLGIIEPNVTSSKTSRSSSRSSSSNTWYYDIGTSLPSGVTPTYDTYNLYNTVKKGDIIFEAKGGFGITGHTAIVEGKYYNAANGVSYIRIVEAISSGVVRSCLDDTRVDDKDVILLRVNGATTSIINKAVSFCVGELGSSYSLDFQKDTSSSETNWYCSELVWAAYKNQGINIEVSGNGEPGITPRDINNSSLTSTINFK